MLVIDKPAGFAVHKGPKGGESLEDHFGALRVRAAARARARASARPRHLGLPRARPPPQGAGRRSAGCSRAAASARPIGRVVEGGPADDEGRIDLPLGRTDATRGWWMKHDPQGQPAVTTWKVLGRTQSRHPGESLKRLRPSFPRGSSSPCGEGLGVGVAVGGQARATTTTPLPSPPTQVGPARLAPSANPGKPGFRREREQTEQAAKDVGQLGCNGDGATHHLTWLALEPLTGRTHQLRVHCAAMGWPILGDSVYGSAPRTGGPACTCTPARSWCRSTRTARRSR